MNLTEKMLPYKTKTKVRKTTNKTTKVSGRHDSVTSLRNVREDTANRDLRVSVSDRPWLTW